MARGTKMRKWAVHSHAIHVQRRVLSKTGTAFHFLLGVILAAAPDAQRVTQHTADKFAGKLPHLMLGGGCRPEASSARWNGREIRHGRGIRFYI